MSQDNVLGQLLFILYTSELFRIVGNHSVGYTDDTMICILCDGIAASAFSSNELYLKFKIAHEVQP